MPSSVASTAMPKVVGTRILGRNISRPRRDQCTCAHPDGWPMLCASGDSWLAMSLFGLISLLLQLAPPLPLALRSTSDKRCSSDVPHDVFYCMPLTTTLSGRDSPSWNTSCASSRQRLSWVVILL